MQLRSYDSLPVGLGKHGELVESFKVTTPDTYLGPKVGYVGRSFDALLRSGAYKWWGRVLGKSAAFNSTFSLVNSSRNDPTVHFGDAIVNVVVDPAFCTGFTAGQCGDETVQACRPSGIDVTTAAGYNRVVTCAGDHDSGSTEADPHLAALRNVSGYVSTLCPVLCKSATAHKITIDVNNMRAEGPSQVNITNEMMIEYAEDKFNMTMAEYINSTNGTLTVEDLESWIMQELLNNTGNVVDFFDGNATNETSSGFSFPVLNSRGGARKCQVIVKVGSAFQLGNFDAAFTLGKGSESTNRRFKQANKDELDVTVNGVEFQGQVNITGPRLNLRTQSMAALSINIETEGGVVDLDDVLVYNMSAGIHVDVHVDGDIIIAPRGPVMVDLDWEQPCGFVCLPQGYFVDDSVCDVADESPESESTSSSTQTSTTTTATTTTTTPLPQDDAGNATNSTGSEAGGEPDPTKFEARECQKRTTCGSHVSSIQITDMNASIAELFSHPHWVHYEPLHDRATGDDDSLQGSGDDDDDHMRSRRDSTVPVGYSNANGRGDGGGGADSFRTEGHLHISAAVQLGSIYLHDSARAVRTAVLEAQTNSRGPVDGSPLTSNVNRPSSGVGSSPPMGANYYEPELSDKLAYDLTPLLNESFSEYEDFVYRILLSTFEPESVWLASTKQVFLQFEPGFLAAFSATILNPHSASFHGRLYPGFCPYRPQPSDNERGIVSDILTNSIEGFQDKSGAVLGHCNKEGLWKYVKETISTEEVDGSLSTLTGFLTMSIHINQNPALLMAIVLSLVLSATLGVGLTIGCAYGVKHVLVTYLKKKETNKRLLQFSTEKAKADNRPASSNMKKDEAKDKKRKSAKHLKPGASQHSVSFKSPFELIDTLVAIYNASHENSLSAFAEGHFKSKPKSYAIPKKEFMEAYTQYCNKNNLIASPLEQSDWGMLASFGIFQEMRNSNSTEVFTNLKFKHVKDYPPLGDTDTVADPVAYFIEQRCQKSMFDYEYVRASRFRERYAEFCKMHEIPKFPVLNRVIVSMGFSFERKTLTFLVKGSNQAAETESAGMIARLWAVVKLSVFRAKAWLAGSLYHSWAIQALPSVAGHVVLSLMIPLPLIFAAFIFQSAAENLKYVGHSAFLVQDAMIGPLPNTLYWGTQESLGGTGWWIALQNEVLFYITLAFYGISALELWAYYGDSVVKYEKAELAKLKQAAAHTSKGAANLKHDERSLIARTASTVWYGVRQFILFLYMPLLGFFLAGSMSYIVLILLWACLGAIINPFKFLPMTAAALTLLTAVIGKAVALKLAKAKLKGALRQKMKERSDFMIKQLKEKVLSKANAIAKNITDGEGGNGGGESGPLARMAKQHLGDFSDDAGLLLRVAKGDVKAIVELSEKIGINPLIARPLIAVAMKDLVEVTRAIKPLAKKIGVDGDLASTLITLASGLNMESKQAHIKNFVNELVHNAMIGKISLPLPKIAEMIKLEVVKAHALSANTANHVDVDKLIADASHGNTNPFDEFAQEAFNALQDLPEDAAKRQIEIIVKSKIGKRQPELLAILHAFPEIASAFLQVVERDIGPFIKMVENNKDLAALFPFPPEVISIANAILKVDHDTLHIESIKLFSYLLGFKKLHKFLSFAGTASVVDGGGSKNGGRLAVTFAGFLETKVVEMMEDQAHISMALAAQKASAEVERVREMVEGGSATQAELTQATEDANRKHAIVLKMLGAVKGAAVKVQTNAEGTLLEIVVISAAEEAVRGVSDGTTPVHNFEEKQKQIKKVQSARANGACGHIEKRIQDLIPPEAEVLMTLCALVHRDPAALEAACWLSGDNSEDNLFQLAPDVARAIMMLTKAEEGASHPNPGTKPVNVQGLPETYHGKILNGMPQKVQTMLRLTMRHKAIEPIARQLGFDGGHFDHRILAGLAALPRDSATMRWARVNEIAGVNKSQRAFGLVALLNGEIAGSEESVLKLCYGCEFDQNPYLFMNILKLRQRNFQRTTMIVEEFLSTMNSATFVLESTKKETLFVEGCSALLQLSTATDARVLRQNLKSLMLLTTGKVGGPKEVEKRANFAVAIAKRRRLIAPLNGHELVHLFAMVVPSSGYYKNENAEECPPGLKNLFPAAQLFQLSHEEIRVVLKQSFDPNSDAHKLLASSIVKICNSVKQLSAQKTPAWPWLDSTDCKPPAEKAIQDAIIGIHNAGDLIDLGKALDTLSSLCNGPFRFNEKEGIKVRRRNQMTGKDTPSTDVEEKVVEKYLKRLADLNKYNTMNKVELVQPLSGLFSKHGLHLNDEHWFALMHMSDSNRKSKNRYVDQKRDFFEGAHRLIGGDRQSLEALYDLSVCVQGKYLASGMKFLKAATTSLCATLDMPQKAFMNMIIVSDPEPVPQSREIRVATAGVILQTNLGLPAEVVAQWKGMALSCLKDVEYVHESLVHVAKLLHIPKEIMFSLAHYSASKVGREADIHSVRSIMLPPLDDTAVGEALVARVARAQNRGQNMLGRISDLLHPSRVSDHEDFLKLYQLDHSSDTAGNADFFQRLVHNKIVQQFEQKGEDAIAIALADRHMLVEGAIAIGSLDPVGVTSVCKALSIANEGSRFKRFEFKTHGLALKLAVTLARRHVVEITEPDVDYPSTNGQASSSAQFLADKLHLPVDYITGLVVLASGDAYDIDKYEEEIGFVAEGLELHPACIKAFIATCSRSPAEIAKQLFAIVEANRIFHPAIASFLVAIGSGDISGLEAACGKAFLDVDVDMVEGLVALATGNPDASRACLPQLAERLRVDPKALTLITRLSARDVSSDQIDAMLPIFARHKSDKPILTEVVRLFNRDRGSVKTALFGLINSANIDIINIAETEALVNFMQGYTAAPSSYFEQSTLGLNIASLLLELMKHPRGVGLNFDSVCRSPVINRWWWVSDAIRCRRNIIGMDSSMKTIGQFLSAIFVAGSKDGADRAPHTLDMETPRGVRVELAHDFSGHQTVAFLRVVKIGKELRPGFGEWKPLEKQTGPDKKVPTKFVTGMHVGDRIYAINGKFIASPNLKFSAGITGNGDNKYSVSVKDVTTEDEAERLLLTVEEGASICFKRVGVHPSYASGTAFLNDKFGGMTNQKAIANFFWQPKVGTFDNDDHDDEISSKPNQASQPEANFDDPEVLQRAKESLYQRLKADSTVHLEGRNDPAESDSEGEDGGNNNVDDMHRSNGGRLKDSESHVGFDVLLLKLLMLPGRSNSNEQLVKDASGRKILSVVRAIYKYGAQLASVVFESETWRADDPEWGEAAARQHTSASTVRKSRSVPKSERCHANLRGASMFGVTPQNFAPKEDSRDVDSWNDNHWIEYSFLGFMPKRSKGGCRQNVYPTILTPVITQAVELAIAIEQPAESDCFKHPQHRDVGDWMSSQGQGSLLDGSSTHQEKVDALVHVPLKVGPRGERMICSILKKDKGGRKNIFDFVIRRACIDTVGLLVDVTFDARYAYPRLAATLFPLLLFANGGNDKGDVSRLTGRSQIDVCRSRSLIDTTSEFFSCTVDKLHLKTSTAGALAGILAHNQAAMSPPTSVMGSRPSYKDLGPLFTELDVENEQQQITLYQLLLASIGKPNLQAYSKVTRTETCVLYKEVEVAASLAKKVGLPENLVRVCLLGGVVQGCPKSNRPKMQLLKHSLQGLVDRFKLDPVKTRMLVGAAAGNRHCLTEFIVSVACTHRVPGSDKSTSDITATVRVLDAIASEEVEILHATSDCYDEQDDDLNAFSPDLHLSRAHRIKHMKEHFKDAAVLTNLQVFAYDLAEATMGTAVAAAAAASTSDSDTSAAGFFGSKQKRDRARSVKACVEAAQCIVDFVSVLLNDRGANQNAEKKSTDVEAFQQWDWGYDQKGARPANDERFKVLADKLGISEVVFQGICQIGCNAPTFSPNPTFWMFGIKAQDTDMISDVIKAEAQMCSDVVQVLTPRDPWRRQMNLIDLAKKHVHYKPQPALHSSFNEDLDALLLINGGKVPKFHNVLTRLQPMYDPIELRKVTSTLRKSLSGDHKLAWQERWGCLVAISANSWEDLYLEKVSWEGYKETAPTEGFLNPEPDSIPPNTASATSNLTFFPGRHLFGAAYREANLPISKPQLRSDDLKYNESKARFLLQLLCDMSQGNMSGLYLTSQYSDYSFEHVPDTQTFVFPGTARQEYCKFLKKGNAELLQGILEPSAGSTSGKAVNIFALVSETLTASWAKDTDDENSFKHRFGVFISGVETPAGAAIATTPPLDDEGDDGDTVGPAASSDAILSARATSAEAKSEALALKKRITQLVRLSSKAKNLAAENKGLIDQIWKGVKLFFQLCKSPGSSVGFGDDLLELITSPLALSKLEEVFPQSKPFAFARNVQWVMNQLDNSRIGAFFFKIATGEKDVNSSQLLSAIRDDIATVKGDMKKKPSQKYAKIVEDAEKIICKLFGNESSQCEAEEDDLLQRVLSEIFGAGSSNASDAGAGAGAGVGVGAGGVGSDLEDMAELKNAFKGNLSKYLFPRMLEALGLPSGLDHVTNPVSVKSKFVTDVLVRILSSDNVQQQIGAFSDMWKHTIRTKLPLIIEDVLSGFPLGKKKHATPLWPPIVLTADAQIELNEAKGKIERVLGEVMAAMISAILALIGPCIEEDVTAASTGTARGDTHSGLSHSRHEMEKVGLDLQLFQAILKFVQSNSGDSVTLTANTLARAIGLKFGVDCKLIDGLISIVSGTFNPTVARSMAPILVGQSVTEKAATEAVCSLIGLAQGDWSQLKALAVKMGGFDEKQLHQLVVGIERLKPLIEKLKRQSQNAQKELSGHVSFVDDDNDLDPTALFLKFDNDNSGSLEFNEFYEVMKVINYPQQITEEKVMKIFVSADMNLSGAVNMAEFTNAIDMSRAQQSSRVLELVGLSKGNMIAIVLSLLAILMVLFGFIFAGIVAFTTLGGFSAVVNSTFPIVGGAGASNSSEVPGDKEDDSQTGQMVETMLEKATNESSVKE